MPRLRSTPFAAVAAATLIGIAGLAPADEHLVASEPGALDGKTVVLSAGHGYQLLSGGWAWQRPLLHEIREDIHTNEIMIEYVQRYLINAGAKVETCRERSFQTAEVVVDDQSAGYAETGTWASSTAVPQRYGARYRYATVSLQQSASASFTPSLPSAGRYPVYVWYTQGANRASDALYRVHHAGGVSEVRVNQQAFGNHWAFLGEWAFLAGSQGKVELSNQGSDPTRVVIADAVRFGGGVGQSGQARYREGAKAFLPHKGFSSTLGEVTIRPAYGVWLAGGDRTRWRDDFAYIALHTNAGGGRGTSTYSYANGRGGVGSVVYTNSPSSLQTASDRLRNLVNDELVRSIRADFDPAWIDRGKHTANFGELRESRNMPSCLIELAFHDSSVDAALLSDARFRHVSGRAIYKAVLRNFDPNATVSPLPPGALRLENLGGGEVRVSWEQVLDPIEPSAAPRGYKVYLSRDGLGFADGVAVAGTSYVVQGLSPGERIYAKVTATNAGGESLATRVAGAIAGDPQRRALLVDGFTRSYRFTHDNWARRYTYDYAREHLAALGALLPSHVALDYAEQSSLGGVQLDPYVMVDWLLGRESSADTTLDAGEQRRVSSYLVNGGRLLISGTEIAWDLGNRGGGVSFLEAQLGARYLRDDAGVSLARGTPRGPFALLGNVDFGRGRYVAATPDVFEPSIGAEALLSYDTAGAPAAGVGIKDRVVTLGFPLEAVSDLGQRTQLVQAALDYLDPDLSAPPSAASSASVGSSGTASTSSSTAAGSTAAGGRGGSGGGCSLGAQDASLPLPTWLLLALLTLGTCAARRRA